MHLSTISHILFKPILRKLLGKLAHQAVATHLRDDAGDSNGNHFAIALDDSFMGKGEIRNPQSIYQAMVNFQRMFLLECRDSSSHGIVRGAKDIFAIDLLRIGKHLGPEHAAVFENFLEQDFAFFFGNFLGIIDPVAAETIRQNHRCHRHRTRERPATGLIDTANHLHAPFSGSSLVTPIRHKH